MKAITIDEPGGPEVLEWTEVPDPTPAAGEVVIDVVAAALNPADVAQRWGLYPVPAGASAYLGLEVSGRISALGPDVTGWHVGDEVCALLTGGGYAQKVAVARVVTTVGGPEKAARARELGADLVVDYRTQDFAEHGPYDVILDSVGGQYLDRNVRSLAVGGRLVRNVWPLIESGAVQLVIDQILPMAEAADAHRVMESGRHIGKILLVNE